MARFVLAHRSPQSAPVMRAETLAVDPADPVARQITAGAHGGLWCSSAVSTTAA
jgi:DNA polymerase-3 subunit delta'